MDHRPFEDAQTYLALRRTLRRSSALVTYALAREVRKDVTVAISGDGGDEVFLGYGRYARFHRLVQQWRAGNIPKLPYGSLFEFEGRGRIRVLLRADVSAFREEHKLNGCGPLFGALSVVLVDQPARHRP